jgi:hypothetical protein
MNNDKSFFKKIQNDIKISKPIIINNDDNLSNIKKNYNSKYTEDLSDSDDDLSSYKLRNRDIINQVKTKEKANIKVKSSNKKSNKEIEEIEELENELNSNNNSDTSEEDVDYEYTEELAEKVKDYVKNDDKIRELQIELKKLNTIKKNAEAEILKHLERLGESNINITGGKLKVNQYESKDSLKEDIIREAIQDKIKDPKIIDNIFDKINEKRISNAKIQISLKRTFERGKKNN